MNKMRILLIEDHLGERLNIMKALSHYGFEIETAVTFNRARDLMQKRQYDLVISEFLLHHCPEVQGDGTEFWSFSQKIHPKTPIVLIANDTVGLTAELIRLKSSLNPQSEFNLTLPLNSLPSVIPKPVKPDVLQSLLEQRLQCVKILAA